MTTYAAPGTAASPRTSPAAAGGPAEGTPTTADSGPVGPGVAFAGQGTVSLVDTPDPVDGSPLLAFHAANTNYVLHLRRTDRIGPVGRLVRGVVRASARKVYGVGSGGNFVEPVVGTPRVVQGRVREASATHLVVQTVATFLIDLPTVDAGVDLSQGLIVPGSLVKVVLFPGATFESTR